MATSQGLTLYDAVQALSVNYDGTLVPARLLQSIGQNVGPTPVRYILVGGPHQQATTAEALDSVTRNSLNLMRWSVEDILYIAPVSSGTGHRMVQRPLIQYIMDYAEALSAADPINTQYSLGQIQGVTYEPGITEYPADSGSIYYTVNVTVTIDELMQ